MRTISVKLPEVLDRELTELARQRHSTRSALVREALEAMVQAHPRSVAAVAGELIGAVDGPADLSSSPDHLVGYGE